MERPPKSAKNLLTQFWQKERYAQLANSITQQRLGAANLWAAPADIEPRRPMMYLSVGIPDSDWLPRTELNQSLRKVLSRKDDASPRYGFGKGYYPVRKYLAEKFNQQAILYINSVIYSEISIGFELIEDLETAISKAVFQMLEIPKEALFLAGKVYFQYKMRKGVKRAPLPDFFIGAHAAVLQLELLTRDISRYRTYFPNVPLISP